MAVEIPKISKQSLDSRTADVLRTSIISGEIPAGTRLTEMEIAKQLDLSRATIRTAFTQLAKEGLLTLVPYSGWSVITLNSNDAWELYTLRSSIERLAAGIVAKDLDDAGEAKLKAAYDELLEACDNEDSDAASKADFNFHKILIGLTEHSRLIWQYDLIEQQIRMLIHSSNLLIEDWKDLIEQHRPMFAALMDRDPVKASELAESHCLSECEKLVSFLSAQEAS